MLSPAIRSAIAFGRVRRIVEGVTGCCQGRGPHPLAPSPGSPGEGGEESLAPSPSSLGEGGEEALPQSAGA